MVPTPGTGQFLNDKNGGGQEVDFTGGANMGSKYFTTFTTALVDVGRWLVTARWPVCLRETAFQWAIDKVATGSDFCSMRSVGIKLLKNKLSEYIRLAAGGGPCWSPTAIASWPSLVRLRRAGAHWFRMRFCSMPFVRGGSGHRYRLGGKCRHENR